MLHGLRCREIARKEIGKVFLMQWNSDYGGIFLFLYSTTRGIKNWCSIINQSRRVKRRQGKWMDFPNGAKVFFFAVMYYKVSRIQFEMVNWIGMLPISINYIILHFNLWARKYFSLHSQSGAWIIYKFEKCWPTSERATVKGSNCC